MSVNNSAQYKHLSYVSTYSLSEQVEGVLDLFGRIMDDTAEY